MLSSKLPIPVIGNGIPVSHNVSSFTAQPMSVHNSVRYVNYTTDNVISISCSGDPGSLSRNFVFNSEASSEKESKVAPPVPPKPRRYSIPDSANLVEMREVTSEDSEYFPFSGKESDKVTRVDDYDIVKINHAITENVGKISIENVNKVPTEHVNKVPTEHVNKVPTEHVNKVPTEHVNKVTTEHVNKVTTEHVNKVPTEHVNKGTTEHVNKMSTEHLDKAIENLLTLADGSCDSKSSPMLNSNSSLNSNVVTKDVPTNSDYADYIDNLYSSIPIDDFYEEPSSETVETRNNETEIITEEINQTFVDSTATSSEVTDQSTETSEQVRINNDKVGGYNKSSKPPPTPVRRTRPDSKDSPRHRTSSSSSKVSLSKGVKNSSTPSLKGCYIEDHYEEVVSNLQQTRLETLFGSNSSIASRQSTWYVDIGASSSNGNHSSSEDGSEVGSSKAASEASTTPNKYGFIGGAQYTEMGEENIPVNVIRKRESKWLEMLNNWDSFMTKKYTKVRDRCRKGIPSAIRARAWQHLCGADRVLERNPGVFQHLVESFIDPRTDEEIRKDLHRQFPLHEMFLQRGGQGQEDLYQVLKVHSLVSGDGYCQAHAPVAAVLLMQMPAEQAFWCLRAICDKYVPGYFSHGLEAIQVDGDILYKLAKKVCPAAYKIIKKQKIDPVLYMTEWFMCLFSRTLPWSSVLRVWDMFFCEGVKVLFRVGLVLLKFGLRSDVRSQCPSMYETLQALRNIAPLFMSEGFLVMHMLNLDITEDDLQKEHSRQLSKREKQQKQEAKLR